MKPRQDPIARDDGRIYSTWESLDIQFPRGNRTLQNPDPLIALSGQFQRSSHAIAPLIPASPGQVVKCRTIKKHCQPETIQELRKGKITITSAYRAAILEKRKKELLKDNSTPRDAGESLIEVLRTASIRFPNLNHLLTGDQIKVVVLLLQHLDGQKFLGQASSEALRTLLSPPEPRRRGAF